MSQVQCAPSARRIPSSQRVPPTSGRGINFMPPKSTLDLRESNRPIHRFSICRPRAIVHRINGVVCGADGGGALVGVRQPVTAAYRGFDRVATVNRITDAWRRLWSAMVDTGALPRSIRISTIMPPSVRAISARDVASDQESSNAQLRWESRPGRSVEHSISEALLLIARRIPAWSLVRSARLRRAAAAAALSRRRSRTPASRHSSSHTI